MHERPPRERDILTAAARDANPRTVSYDVRNFDDATAALGTNRPQVVHLVQTSVISALRAQIAALAVDARESAQLVQADADCQFRATALLLAPAGVPDKVVCVLDGETAAIMRGSAVCPQYDTTGADPGTDPWQKCARSWHARRSRT